MDQELPPPRKRYILYGILIISGLFWWVIQAQDGLLSFLNDPAWKAKQSSTVVPSDVRSTVVVPPKNPAKDSYATIGGHPACMTREQLARMLQFLSQNDRGAVEKMIESGSCVVLKPQVWGFIMDGDPSSVVKFRPQGQTDGMWTVGSAIR